jgi:hypothetical protein
VKRRVKALKKIQVGVGGFFSNSSVCVSPLNRAFEKRRKVKAKVNPVPACLGALQSEHAQIEAQYQREILALDRKYGDMYAGMYEKVRVAVTDTPPHPTPSCF